MISVSDVLNDIKVVIRLEGKDKLTYELSNDEVLVIEVVDNAYGNLEISVEKLDEFGNTIECATDDYDCSDETLIAMIENALF